MAEKGPLSDAQAKRLIRLYGEAETEILKEVNRLLLKNPESYSLAWQKTLLARVQQIRADLLAGSRTWCQEAISDSYMRGVSWADEDPLAGTKVLAGFGKIHEQAVQVLADNAYSRLADVNNVVGRRVDDVFRSVALEHAKGSVIGYQTTRQTAKRIREDLAERGITGFVDKAGHEWDLKRYSKVLAQETTNGAFRQGTINRFQEKGHSLVRLSSHSGSCPKCTPWQGRTMSLTGNDPEYPSIEDAKAAGVFHVSCLHVISLAPEELDRFIGVLQGKKGEAARQAEIDRLAAKWEARNKDKFPEDLRKKAAEYKPNVAQSQKKAEPIATKLSAPSEPVVIQKGKTSSGEKLPDTRVTNKLHDYDEFGPKMRGAIKYYTGEGFRDINHPLRHGGELSDLAQDAMERLDGLLDDEFLTKGVTYRGYDSKHFLLTDDDELIGSTFTDPAFVSTSHNKANASIFINTAKHPVMAEIHIPDGARGFDIPSKFTEYDVGESEVLLPRDSEFEVVSRDIREGITWVKLRLVT